MTVTIEKAQILNAEALREIMARTFDEEAKRWLTDGKVVDANIQPPGYSSIEMSRYMIEELDYYIIKSGIDLVGGLILTITGGVFGRIDRIFIDPSYQGQKIGSSVITLLEQEFPIIKRWELETSSRQINNHRFYEKMGYTISYKTDEEYGYSKEMVLTAVEDGPEANLLHEDSDMAGTVYHQVSLAKGTFSNSNLAQTDFTNCNLSHAKFRNINLKQSLFADLNLSRSKFRLVTLNGVRFMDTDLINGNEPISFERCDLSRTTMTGSNLSNVQIQDCELTGMTIDGIPVEKLLAAYFGQMQK